MLLWVDGFDHYGGSIAALTAGGNYSAYGVNSTQAQISTAQKRTNTHALYIHGGNTSDDPAGYLRKALPGGSETQLGIGFASYLSALPANNDNIRLDFNDFANATNWILSITTTGAIQAKRANGTVLGTTATPVVTAAAWHHIEVFTVMSDTVGEIKVWVNEELVLNLTALDNVNTALAECSQIQFEVSGVYPSATGNDWYIDDLYIYDTSGSINNAAPLGDLNAYLLVPTGDTSEADWSLSTGANGYALIDESTPNDADYIQSATAGDRSEFDLTDLPLTVNYVAGLFCHTRALKTDAGGAQLETSIMSSGSRSTPNAKSITTAATWWHQAVETDPATGSRFTRSGVNDAKIRFDRLS
jgi:hypothetical protein